MSEYGDKKYIYQFSLTHLDGNSVTWRGVQSVRQIREIVEGELKKLA